MIVIDMDMPKSCDECPLFDDRWDYPTCYVNQLSSGYNFPIRDKRMDFCPIKCDINDIKAEILEETECHYGDKCLGANCPSNTDCMIMGEHAIEIIDQHIGERSE